MESSPPHIVIKYLGGARVEVRFELPDVWKIKHIGPDQELLGCNPPCTGRYTQYFQFTTEELAQRAAERMDVY